MAGEQKAGFDWQVPVRKRRRSLWLWVACVVFVVASLPVLWSIYLRPEPPSDPTRAAVPTTAQAPAIPSYGGERPREGFTPAAAVGDCDDLKVLVDRSHPLPPDYAPADLVPLQDLGVPTIGDDTLLRREAADRLAGLVFDAAASGEELIVASAYRSYEDQSFSYARLVSIYGEGADRTSAPPGRSQHQLGTAVDFTNSAVGYEVHRHFGRTTASLWLRAHAHEHGFVLAYPPGGEKETGYQWEPWHYRYIGKDNARRVVEKDLGLQAFLQKEGIDNCRT
jgi:zinc D-Ala-D-Ala carboxypeptidase